jgi:hypothetical protein
MTDLSKMSKEELLLKMLEAEENDFTLFKQLHAELLRRLDRGERAEKLVDYIIAKTQDGCYTELWDEIISFVIAEYIQYCFQKEGGK